MDKFPPLTRAPLNQPDYFETGGYGHDMEGISFSVHSLRPKSRLSLSPTLPVHAESLSMLSASELTRNCFPCFPQAS